MLHRNDDIEATPRRAKNQRAGGKRTIYGDSPGPGGRAVGPEAPERVAGEPDDGVDAFWRDALDRIS